MRLSPLEVLCKEEYQEVKPIVVDPKAKHNLLKEFYGEEPLDLNVDNFGEGIEKIRSQVGKIIHFMVAAGLSNFSDLKAKFHDLGTLPYMNKPSTSKQIKEYMESLLYVYINSSEEKKQRFINKCKDRKFECGAGTLTNLIMVYSELTLANQSIGSFIGFAKRELAEQALMEEYRSNFFAPEFPCDWRWEIHHIPNLINAVASKYRLAFKTKEEDHYIKDNVSQLIAERVDVTLKVTLSNNVALLTMVEGVVERVTSALPPLAEHHSLNSFGKEINDFFEQLGIKVPSRYYCVAETGERGYAKNYKHNVAQIVRNLVIVYMQDAGIITSPEYTYAKETLALESSMNDDAVPCVTKEVFDSSENQDRDWLYICRNALALDEEGFGVTNPFLHNRKIYSKDPIQYFIDKKEEVKGMNPLVYALEYLDLEIFKRQKLKTQKISELLFEVNKPESVTKLVKLGANLDVLKDVNVTKSDGSVGKLQCTPLIRAIQLNKVGVVRQILVEIKQKKQNEFFNFIGLKGDFEKLFLKTDLLWHAASRDNPAMLQVVLEMVEEFSKENKKPNFLFELCCGKDAVFFRRLIQENKFKCFKIVLDKLNIQKGFKEHLVKFRHNSTGFSYLHMACVANGEFFEALINAMGISQEAMIQKYSEEYGTFRGNIFHLAASVSSSKSLLKAILSKVENRYKPTVAKLLCARDSFGIMPLENLVQNAEKFKVVLEALKDNEEALDILFRNIEIADLAIERPEIIAIIFKSLKNNDIWFDFVYFKCNYSPDNVEHVKLFTAILNALKDDEAALEKTLSKVAFAGFIANNKSNALSSILGVIGENEFLLRKCLFKHLDGNTFVSHIAEAGPIYFATAKVLFAVASKHEQLFFDMFDDGFLFRLLTSSLCASDKSALFNEVKGSKFYPKFLEKAISLIQSNADKDCFEKLDLHYSIKLILEEYKTASNEVQELLFKKWDESKKSLASALITYNCSLNDQSLVDILLSNESLLKKVISFKSYDTTHDFVLLNSSVGFFEKLVKDIKEKKPALLSLFIDPQAEGSESLFMQVVKSDLTAQVSSMLSAVGRNVNDVVKLYSQKDASGKDVLRIAFDLGGAREMFKLLIAHTSKPLGVFLCLRCAATIAYEKCSTYTSSAAKFVYENRADITKAAVVTCVSAVFVYAAISRGASAVMAA